MAAFSDMLCYLRKRSGPDCPFVEYCFRAAGELSDEAVAQAFDALTDGTPEGICGRVLASRRSQLKKGISRK